MRIETPSERYDIAYATICFWLDRFEQQSISEAIEDQFQPGRQAKLALLSVSGYPMKL